jgi:hypothetical protein
VFTIEQLAKFGREFGFRVRTHAQCVAEVSGYLAVESENLSLTEKPNLSAPYCHGRLVLECGSLSIETQVSPAG